jgi:hypothetical protein
LLYFKGAAKVRFVTQIGILGLNLYVPICSSEFMRWGDEKCGQSFLLKLSSSMDITKV